MKFETTCVVSGDHPSLAGHFPGTPIVPGVVILERVLEALHAENGDSKVIAIPAVKFLTPLLPDQVFSIHLRGVADQTVRFECHRAGQILARGELRCTDERSG